MNIQIWSDVMCPFCFIGKRNFETALAKFPQRDQVTVDWKSFELDPYAQKFQEPIMAKVLAAKYKKSVEEGSRMMEQVTATAKKAGLEFHLNKAIPTNSFDAHRLIHLAAKHGKQGEAKEAFFSAYLVNGEDLASVEVLKKIATSIGLPPDEVNEVLTTERYTEEVRNDEKDAYHMQIRGVPYFVFGKKLAVSGAQPVEQFETALQQAWEKLHPR